LAAKTELIYDGCTGVITVFLTYFFFLFFC